MIAVAGTEEVIRLFNLKTKKSCGEFSGGVHESTITSLAISKNGTHLLSGDDSGKIVIWRISDGLVLHELKIFNESRVVSLSMHNSGRMLLALYANGMLRLWNLLDGRCIFKRKVGLSDEDSSEDLDDSENEEGESQPKKQSSKPKKVVKEEGQPMTAEDYTQKYLALNKQSVMVRWEPSKGLGSTVLFTRLLEIYSVEDDVPLHSVTFDCN